MSKRAKYLHLARRIYCEDLGSIEECAQQCTVTPPTISNWKIYDREQNGIDWDAEREKTRDRLRTLDSQTEEFITTFIRRLNEDVKAGEEISVGRLYVMKDLLPAINAMRQGKDPLQMPEMDFNASLNDIIKSQASVVVQQLYNEDLKSGERLKLLKQLAQIRKDIQKAEIESHMKHLDAQLLSNIIRRFQPEATDDEVIKIYREECDRLGINV